MLCQEEVVGAVHMQGLRFPLNLNALCQQIDAPFQGNGRVQCHIIAGLAVLQDMDSPHEGDELQLAFRHMAGHKLGDADEQRLEVIHAPVHAVHAHVPSVG